MPSCGISFLNETEQTNETQTNFGVFCAMRLDFVAVRFLFVCQLASAIFCGDGLLKGSDQTTETSSFPEHVHVCQSIF